MNWLLRSVSSPSCLHDLLWFFVAALEGRTDPPSSSPGGNPANAAAEVDPSVAAAAAGGEAEKVAKEKRNRKNQKELNQGSSVRLKLGAWWLAIYQPN